MKASTLLITVQDQVAHVSFNRPDKANALNQPAWDELESTFRELDEHEEVRVVVLSGEGRHFCGGIDLELLFALGPNGHGSCEGRQRETLRRQILALQAPINAIEQCSKPVLAAVHGGCIGAGLDIVCACDSRYCTTDAYFSIKEIEMGMVADLGTLQRLPRLIPQGLARELAYTGRKLPAAEAEKAGLVNQTFASREELLDGVLAVAHTIASRSPLSVRGTKHILNHARDHSVDDGLAYMATWNAAMLLSDDLREAFSASQQKRQPNYP
jgi:enoyl-CoA hydratase